MRQFIWITAERDSIKLEDMTYDHIYNCMNIVKRWHTSRKHAGLVAATWYHAFSDELVRRRGTREGVQKIKTLYKIY